MSRRNDERQAFDSIVARLYGLADIAERASVLPQPILMLILWILRPAEAVARRYALDLCCDLGLWTDLPRDLPDVSDSADAAIRLAVHLRMLAALMHTLAAFALAGFATAFDWSHEAVRAQAGTGRSLDRIEFDAISRFARAPPSLAVS